jgi:AraC family transcriptional regulator, activator of mtrCDE
MAEDCEVIDNPAMHRFELPLGDEVTTAYYAIEHGRVVITHTEVPFALSGRGYGSRLARGAFEAARARGMRVIAKCPFMAAYALTCGRFFIAPPPDRPIRNYMPANLVARAMSGHGEDGVGSASNQLANLVSLMRMESAGDRAGGRAILNALSSALFTLVSRAASEAETAPEGLLALAGHPRLAPAIAAMFADPTRSWKRPDLADLCGMSRATFTRHFQGRLGCSALDLLTDLRMSLAANKFKKPAISTEAVAETAGYQSVSAFRRVFADRMGMTPGEWRRLAHNDEQSGAVRDP